MARILLTGANGHIGANTARKLLQRGHHVIPFVHPDADLRGIEKLGLSYRVGSIFDPESLLMAAVGCEVIIFTDAMEKTRARTSAEVITAALTATRNIFQAARQASTDLLIYSSSIAAVGSAENPFVLKVESDWNQEVYNPYFKARLFSEQEAVRLSKTLKVPCIRLCPTYALGPYDYQITPSTSLLLRLINGTGLTWEGGLNLVHIQDVAEAHAAAIDSGEPGKRYIIGGANLLTKEIGECIHRLTGIQPKHFRSNRQQALYIAKLSKLSSKMIGSGPIMTATDIYEFIQRYWYSDSYQAYQTFNIFPHGSEETIRDGIRWLVHLGAVKDPLAEQHEESLSPDPEWETP